jgi:hypothetical protein
MFPTRWGIDTASEQSCATWISLNRWGSLKRIDCESIGMAILPARPLLNGWPLVLASIATIDTAGPISETLHRAAGIPGCPLSIHGETHDEPHSSSPDP